MPLTLGPVFWLQILRSPVIWLQLQIVRVVAALFADAVVVVAGAVHLYFAWLRLCC